MKLLSIIAIAALLILSYQNCGEQSSLQLAEDILRVDKLQLGNELVGVSGTGAFYDPLENRPTGAVMFSSYRLNLIAGTVNFYKEDLLSTSENDFRKAFLSCELQTDFHKNVASFLAEAEICKKSFPKKEPGQITCLALPMPIAILHMEAEDMELIYAPCGPEGVDFCKEEDKETFKSIADSLSQDPQVIQNCSEQK